MKTAAVIAEWNPFHNGHAYFLSEVRKRSGADYILAVMSGDFVQRGAPAIVDKYKRTKMALDGGADLVIELPVAAATGSAGEFAAGAVSVLERTGVVDELWFGSECGAIHPFLQLADILAEEPDSFRTRLQEAAARGLSFPAARADAARAVLKKRQERTAGDIPADSAEAAGFDPEQLLSQPNNILGLAYCIELKKRGSRIRPYTVRREGAGYHARDKSDCAQYPSAEAIRGMLLHPGNIPKQPEPEIAGGTGRSVSCRMLERVMPEDAAAVMAEAEEQNCLMDIDDFSDMLYYRLLQECPASMLRYYGMSESLANRILSQMVHCKTVSSLAQAIKAKHLTRSGIDRILLRILLGIDHDAVRQACECPILRVLGFRNCDPLLRILHENAAVPYEMRVSAIPAKQYKSDLFASHLYEWVRAKKSGGFYYSEYKRMVVK